MSRERIDSLSDVMRTLAVARQAHTERMDKLESLIRSTKEESKRRIEDLEISSKRGCLFVFMWL